MLGGSGALHPMAGPWPKVPAREQWTPPAGWKKPTKPVTSWYDRGDRLVDATPAQQMVGTVTPTGGTVAESAGTAPAGFEWGATY